MLPFLDKNVKRIGKKKKKKQVLPAIQSLPDQKKDNGPVLSMFSMVIKVPR